jgi:hypothetical protein
MQLFWQCQLPVFAELGEIRTFTSIFRVENPLESFQGRLLSTDLQRLDDQDGIIKAEWKRLFSDHADRVLYGSDIGPEGRIEQCDQIEEYYRGILMQVDAHVAEKIAYSNAEKIFRFSGQ